MARKGSKRVSFISHDINETKPTASLRTNFDAKAKMTRSQNKQKASSPVRVFRFIRVNVVKAIRRVVNKRRPSTKEPSCMVVVPHHQQQQHFVPHRDSHHSENLEDCIEFINSSYRKSI